MSTEVYRQDSLIVFQHYHYVVCPRPQRHDTDRNPRPARKTLWHRLMGRFAHQFPILPGPESSTENTVKSNFKGIAVSGFSKIPEKKYKPSGGRRLLKLPQDHF